MHTDEYVLHDVFRGAPVAEDERGYADEFAAVQPERLIEATAGICARLHVDDTNCGPCWLPASGGRYFIAVLSPYDGRVNPVLDGTVALVTGASSGIGAATATALAGQGAAVALAARRGDRLEALAAGIRDQGGTALVLECDVTDEQQATGAVERTVAELGRLDTLINNAGVMLLGPAVGAPLPEWQQMVQLNVLGLLYCAHAALPHLLRAAQDGPRQVADMVNISSVAGRAARNGNGVYALTKFGVGAFSESLRQEVTKRYVRVCLVEPGATATELASHNRPEVLESLRSQIGQTMEAGDIADAITYVVTRPRHVTINEMLIRPTEQER
jgi:NADP-dependent 3-hydroxy acid dehydrogenase YdfG